MTWSHFPMNGSDLLQAGRRGAPRVPDPDDFVIADRDQFLTILCEQYLTHRPAMTARINDQGRASRLRWLGRGAASES